jgi:hypothetical protein
LNPRLHLHSVEVHINLPTKISQMIERYSVAVCSGASDMRTRVAKRKDTVHQSHLLALHIRIVLINSHRVGLRDPCFILDLQMP